MQALFTPAAVWVWAVLSGLIFSGLRGLKDQELRLSVLAGYECVV
ncbi:hypothetical protein [Iodobacter fluviatilis]|nr:hypothetical protein [Iodobacter fluviatilis]